MDVKANGIRFSVAVDRPSEGAETKPWLVFSNSLATNLSMWDAQAAHFKERFRVLRYDQRGHGLSDAPGGRYTFDLLVADAIGLFDALGIERAHFVGISMGGMTALGLAEQHPDRVLSIAPCDCSSHSTPQSTQQWEERIALAQERGMEGMVESTLARWFPAEIREANPPYLPRVAEMVRSTPLEGYVGCSAALANFDYQPRLREIACPVLVVAGTRDGMLSGSQQIHTDLPSSGFVTLEGAGHLSNLDRPDDYNRTLDAFLGTVAA